MKLFHYLWLPTVVVVALGCQSGSQPPKEKIYEIKGTVVSLDTAKPSVKLDHQDIPGFMKAMVMDFPVTKPGVLAGLAAGDKVQGRLRVQADAYAITQLEKQP